jgi:hypothetical protein
MCSTISVLRSVGSFAKSRFAVCGAMVVAVVIELGALGSGDNGSGVAAGAESGVAGGVAIAVLDIVSPAMC